MPYWTDKVALITGGSGGLGSALGEAFAAAGAKVVLAARNAERLETVVARIRQSHPNVLAVAADVTQQADVENLVRRTIDEFGRLDVLVNAAGRSARGQVIDTTPEEFAELLDLNFLAVVRCVRAAVPHLLKTQGPSGEYQLAGRQGGGAICRGVSGDEIRFGSLYAAIAARAFAQRIARFAGFSGTNCSPRCQRSATPTKRPACPSGPQTGSRREIPRDPAGGFVAARFCGPASAGGQN